jgi:hypothetical protein
MGLFYHLIHTNANAAKWIDFWLRGLHPHERLVGVKQRAEALVHELVKRLSPASEAESSDSGYSKAEPSNSKPSISLYLNHRLTAFYPQPDGGVLL